MSDVYVKNLIHQWNFADSALSTQERLNDLVGNVSVSLGYNAEITDNGLYLSYGNADYMKAYALMKGVVGRGRRVEVDVAEFDGDWDSGQHGRFIMFDDSETSFDEGLIFNYSTQLWAFYDEKNGWGAGFSGLEKNSFSGKTVVIDILADGQTNLYVDDEWIGAANTIAEEKTNLAIGSNSKAATGAVVSEVRVYSLTEGEYYTVRFLDKDGLDVISTQTVEKGGSAIAPVPPSYKGFIFIGWSTSFSNITEDITVYPRYREVLPHPTLDFYTQADSGVSGKLIKSYSGVNACTINQKLDGECTVDFTLMTKQIEGVISIKDRLEVEGLVFYITEIKKHISNGICYTQMSGEHISYLLNDEQYNVTSFDRIASPKSILRDLLAGTPFTVGNVDFDDTVVLMINQNATRRACLMQLVALVGGEIEYSGYTIGIRKHLGSESAIDIMKTSMVQDISYSYNVSEETTNYTLSLYQKGKLNLGDELQLKFKPLSIDTENRIVGITWNPFNYKEVSVTVGQYIPTVNESLYQLASEVQDIRQSTAKYTVEFGEMIGNGTFYFTRAYKDRPYFHIHTDDGSEPTVVLNKKDGDDFAAYVGATLSGAESTTKTLIVFYCTVPTED